MNPSLHAICQTQRVKTIVACAVFGGALCVACAAVTLAEEVIEPSSVEHAAATSGLPFLPDASVPPTTIRLSQQPRNRSSRPVSSPARWADLSNPTAQRQPSAMAKAIYPPRIDLDRPWTAPPDISATVHVGPPPSAFRSEPFWGSRFAGTAPAPRPLRPIRLPPTGYFDESMTSSRIATGPKDSR